MAVPAPKPPPAYLATRGGGGWRDLYRLDPRAVTTVGRSAECRVVLADDRASRTHAEVAFDPAADGDAGTWTVRDAGSRNGTFLNDERLPSGGSADLSDGDELTVGGSRLVFTFDPSAPLADPGDDRLAGETRGLSDPELRLPTPDAAAGAKILDRRRSTALADGGGGGDRRVGSLYRLALALGSATDPTEAGRAALDVLLDHTPADIGAVLLLTGDDEPAASQGDDDSDAAKTGRAVRAARRLSLVAHRARRDGPYRLVSESVSRAVLTDGSAILAEDVSDDDRLAGRDSLGKLRADSLACAPLRTDPGGGEGAKTVGLVHLYSLDPDNPLDGGDLDFTLAVADQLAVALGNLAGRDDLEHQRDDLAEERKKLADGLKKAERANASLRQTLAADGEMVGDSAATRRLKSDIAQIAPTDATVLVRGESGVGKELVARAIHLQSRRSDGPLVTMNCAALTESLLESELFGHEKGAFTGATAKTVGKFEAADGGTLFLDEVGEMSPAIQAKFLRVLEGHPFERVGGRQPITCDVRVVAATNRDLESAVERGTFRRDLYYRLHVVVLSVEPLRDRPGDIPPLAERFLTRSAAGAGRPVGAFSPAAEELLRRYAWPGNVRELRNAVERAVVLCRGDRVEPADLRLAEFSPPAGAAGGAEPAGGSPQGDPHADRPTEAGFPPAGPGVTPADEYRVVSLEELEREHVLATLTHTGWNKSKAAAILGIERSTLDRKLKKYGVKRPGADVKAP